MKRASVIFNLFALTLLAALSGCGDGGVTEVKGWMDQTRRETRVWIPKLSPPKKFTPFVYDAKAAVDPFSIAKLNVAFAKMQANSGSSLRPDLQRRREWLESFPLDTLKMVGTLSNAGQNAALLQADKAIVQVRVGAYLGQNMGRVTSISEDAIELKEIVQDASGDWVERKTKLELQETKK